MKTSGKVALGGVMGALAMVCLLGTVFPYATYALPAMAGVLLAPVAIEAGRAWGWLTYAAVAFLNLLITPSIEAKVLFVAVLGYYPLLKLTVDRHSRLLSWVVKLEVFNGTVVGSYWLILNVLAPEEGTFELFGVNLPLVFLALGNVTLILFDLCLDRLTDWYMATMHPRLHRLFRL